MEFFIRKDSQEPLLVMKVYHDEKYLREPIGDRLESSVITFTMIDDKGRKRILESPCKLVKEEYDYYLVYMWKKDDTKKIGVYEGIFTIRFMDNEFNADTKVVLPIQQKLMINII